MEVADAASTPSLAAIDRTPQHPRRLGMARYQRLRAGTARAHASGWLAREPETAKPTGAGHLGRLPPGAAAPRWTEGSEVMFERRYAEGVIERFPRLARELVELNVDLIVAVGDEAAAAGKQATDRIPIVFASVGDPVGRRLVSSLARPGGNLTGLTTQGGELNGNGWPC